MQLSELLEGYSSIPAEHDSLVSGLNEDSRTIQAGEVFVALVGQHQDGRRYRDDALRAGAVAVVQQGPASVQLHASGLGLVISLPNLVQHLGELAARFYHYPSHSMTLVGITGTNGKTSCSHFIANSLCQLGRPTGMIGTLGAGFPERLQATGFTTPNPIQLQRTLAQLREQGARCVAMEVSSHALAQQRINGTEIAIGLLTNITQDHLDFHKSMAQYSAAKRRLFERPLTAAVLNFDDPYGRRWAATCEGRYPIYGYSQTIPAQPGATVYATTAQFDRHGITADIVTPWGDGQVSSRLLGQFTLSNILATVAVLGVLQVPLNESLAAIAQLQTVPGRMQTFGGSGQPLVVVDYAHTPDALQRTLASLRAHCQGTLTCVFGCGGDRDHAKRPIMGRIAEQQSDKVIITNDNPRTEKPRMIARQIQHGMAEPINAIIELDRQAAITLAISRAAQHDIILVAGKGHEAEQQIGTKTVPFSDAEVVIAILNGV